MATIYFDMDGTLADLYGVSGWLDYLLMGDERPYAIAQPLLNLSLLARYVNQLQKIGYKIGIISWLAKNSDSDYDELVTAAKLQWLKKHLASVHFDVIHIVEYGTPKEIFSDGNDILFDDEEPNREKWSGVAYDVNNIIEVLKNLKNF